MIIDKLLTELKYKLIKKREYNYIIPIGEGCYTAQILKDYGNRSFSFPFDWVRTPNYMSPINLLINDLDDFFNKEYLEYFETYDLTKEDWYIDKKSMIIFRHEFSANSSHDFDKFYEKVYEKYKRRCERLVNIINDYHIRKICLLYIERVDAVENTHRIPNKVNNHELKKVIDKLNRHFKKNCFDMFYFKHEPKYNFDKFKIEGRICHLNNTYHKEGIYKHGMGNYEIINEVIKRRFGLKYGLNFFDKINILIDYYRIVNQ